MRMTTTQRVAAQDRQSIARATGARVSRALDNAYLYDKRKRKQTISEGITVVWAR
jgi:hypothetical protein